MSSLENLSPEQRDGVACVECGEVDAPMVPIGILLDGVQLFACSDHPRPSALHVEAAASRRHDEEEGR